MPRIRWKRTILWAVLALLAAGIVAPILVTLNFWNRSIASALSSGLGRQTRIGSVHPKLFGGLGFEIDNAVLEDDPRFGIEPFARIESLRATIGASTLWKGRLIFSNLVFVNPRLNIVRMTSGEMAGHWNVESLGTRTIPPPIPTASLRSQNAPPAGPAFQPLPKLIIEDGRINYKTNDRKRVYLVDDLDMEITPASSASEPWHLTFEGRPKRTDFPLNPGSRFRGQATFGPFPGEGDTLTHVDLIAESAFVGDILKIITGVDEGVHGWINLNLHLAGTTSLLRISGTADMRDLHRWDRIPTAATKVLHSEVSAVLDLDRGSLEVRTASIPVGQGKAVLHGDITQLFHQPHPNLVGDFQNIPLSDVVDIAKQFTGRLDSRLTAIGTLNGTLHTNGSIRSIDGNVAVEDARFEIRDTQQSAKVSNAEFVLKGSTIHAGPATVTLEDDGKLQWSFDGNLDKKQYSWRIDTKKTALPSLLTWTRAIGSRWGRTNFSKGDLALQLNYQVTEGKPSLAGWADITGAQFDSRATSEPVRVAIAHLDFRPDKITVKPLAVTIGKLELAGSLVAKGLPVPGTSGNPLPSIEFDARASALDLAVLTQLFNPGPPPSFFPFGGKEQAGSEFFHWLDASGNIEAPAFRYRDKELRNFKAQLAYRNRVLEVENFRGELAGGTHTGSATIRFDGKEPRFAIENQFAKVDVNLLTKDTANWSGYFTGKIGGSLHIQGTGRTTKEIVESLTGWGEASGAGMDLRGINLVASLPLTSPVTHISTLSSKFQIAKKQVVIKEMKMTADSPAELISTERIGRANQRSSLTVSGTVGFDRTIDIASIEQRPGAKGTARELRWKGTMEKPLAEIATAPIESAARRTAK